MMKRVILIFIVLLINSLLFSQTNLPILDSRALGMGGAFVTESPINPANLGFKGDILNGEIGGNIGVNGFITGEYNTIGPLLKDADRITDILDIYGGIENLQNKFESGPTYNDIQNGIKIIEGISDLETDTGSGAYLEVDTHLDIFFANIGIYVNVWGHAGIQALINKNALALSTESQMNTAPDEIWGNTIGTHELTDSQKDLATEIANNTTLNQAQAEEIVYQAVQAGVDVDDPYFRDLIVDVLKATSNNETTIDKNESGVIVRTIVLSEFNISYGQKFLEIFSAGINLKVVQARLYERKYTLKTIKSGEDLFDDLKDYIDEKDKSMERFNIDLGLTARPLPGLKLGVYARNLIPYSYEYPSGYNVDIHTQFRAGASFSFLDIFTVAVDIDLNKVEFDTIKGYNSQTISGGIEAKLPFNIPLLDMAFRCGVFKNLAEGNEDALITLGIGIKFWKFYLDAGGRVSWFKKVDIEVNDNDVDVFQRAGFAVNFGFSTDI